MAVGDGAAMAADSGVVFDGVGFGAAGFAGTGFVEADFVEADFFATFFLTGLVAFFFAMSGTRR